MKEINIDRIFAAFKRSGKKHILITGSKGSGKTTLARAISGDSCAGFESYAVPGEKVVLCNRLTGEESIIGRFSSDLGKMEPYLDGFENAIKAIEQAACYSGNVLIDEIGYLESEAYDFQRAVFQLLDLKNVVLTVRKEKTDFICALMSREDVFALDIDVFSSVGCVIMASGFGKRFGSNKLLGRFGDKTLFERAIDATDGVFNRRVVITRYEEIACLCEEMKIEYVLHNKPDRSDTVRLGIENMDNMSGCMFCPCDQPLLDRKTVLSLAEQFAEKRENIWRLSSKGEVGMPVIFPEKLFSELALLRSGGGASVIKKHIDMLRLYETDKPEALLDADTPEALEKLEKQYL